MEMEQWQYEVTGGGRIWYLVDVEKRTLWLRHAGLGILVRPNEGEDVSDKPARRSSLAIGDRRK
ncbi:hypothetical protein I552_6011 [Mycobacterium xenopi 3993]|nr:hypothetical protein I552_6011 [Mycobacterium xenopi 3993]